ncbi:MAG: 3-phosphoshikimate 1-carboxyvinyltransferase [Clostridia bacterium]|nr:3-phosphoshikimate 1-carboxyvinyltransferase [Clostridia bacterium]
MKLQEIKKLTADSINVAVPASKSILSRALILAAFTEGDTLLHAGRYGEDTRDMLSCLRALGFAVEELPEGLLVHGVREIPNSCAALNVGSAGTAARFLTAVLALRGGDYTLYASPQMERRPMDMLTALEAYGVRIEYLGAHGHFPFRMQSTGISAQKISIDTQSSTQYASGLMLAAAVGSLPLTISFPGGRSSYIAMTGALIEAFGGKVTQNENEITVNPISVAPKEYATESDVSAACYFYALSLLLRTKVCVKNIHRKSLQGDTRFLSLLEDAGVLLESNPEGILADGSSIENFCGFDLNMQEFSDQALTVAALAPFASSPTRIRGIAHIRKQECDRINAIVENLTALGVPSSATEDEIYIEPAPVRGGTVKSFGDHRVAMAFALIGLKTGNLFIENPSCVRKTFDNYFEILDELTR